MISGDSTAYRYLERTVSSFPYGQALVRHIEAVGFENVSATPLTFGTVMIYSADKPESGKSSETVFPS